MTTGITRREMILGSAAAIFAATPLAHAAAKLGAATFADNPSISWPQPYIASRDGLWQENGIQVAPTSQRFGTGQSSLNAMLQSEKVDMAVVAETPVTLALIAGMPLRIIAGLSSTTWQISTRRQTKIQSLSDLAGHRIGVAVGTSAEYFMDKALSSVGLTQKDVQVINVKPTDMVPALSGGSLDAFFIWDPFRFEARRILGDDYVELSYPAFRSNAFLVASSEFVDGHEGSIDAILKSLIKANASMIKSPQDSASYMAQLMQLDTGIASSVWDAHKYEVALREQMLDAFESYAAYVIEKGMLPKGTNIPDFKSCMLVDHLRSIDSTLVDV